MSPRRLFLAAYTISGLAALLYEVAWTRMLTLQMGHTVAAVSTVLAAYMGGLALGTGIAGRLALRFDRRRSLQACAALEFAIAVCAWLLPPALSALRPVLAWAYAGGDAGATFGLIRGLLSFALVIVPTVAMGATFPIAVRWYVGRADHAGADAGALYAANAAGAAAGAVLTGFVLLPAVGLFRTTLIGVVLNATAGLIALALARNEPAAVTAGPPRPLRHAPRARQPAPRRTKPTRAPAPQAPVAEPQVGRPWLAAAALALSGFVALAYEVAWTHVLALIIGPTSYAFSAMLAAVIGGVAIGSSLGAWLAARTRRAACALGVAVALAAGAAFIVTLFIGRLPLIVAGLVSDPAASFTSVVWLQSALIAALLLPMSVASGAAFPLAFTVAAGARAAVPQRVALVYAANTLGAIAGSLAAGFALLPLLGLQTTILAVGTVGVLGGGVVLLVGGGGLAGRVGAAALGLAALAAAAFGPRWDQELLSAGAYKYAPYYRNTDVRAELEAGTLLYYREGASATVSVKRTAGTVALAIDGKVDASNGGDMLTQKLLAHVPLLLHPQPRQVAIIGLGSGVTLGAALRHPVERVDMLEISPEVVEASVLFAADNDNALADPRTNLILGDGRSHMLLTDRRYDVIVSEPSNPWMAGVASLFTQEFFQAARSRLAPGGLICQWAHTYDISEADIRSIIATFASVFPAGTMWLVGSGDLLLVGGVDAVEPRLDNMPAAWARPGVADDLARVGIRKPFSVLSLFVGGPEALREYANHARIQTDDGGTLEFSAPRGIYGLSRVDIAAQLRALGAKTPLPPALKRALASATAAEWRDRGTMQLAAEGAALAYGDFARAVALDPADTEALAGLGRSAGAAGRLPEATSLLRDLAAHLPANAAVRTRLSNVLAAQGQTAAAVKAAEEATQLAPSDVHALEQLASVFADTEDVPRLNGVVERLVAEHPDHPARYYYAATLHFLRDEGPQAVTMAERGRALDPTNARALNLLGAAYARQGNGNAAREAFEAAVRMSPHDPTAYVNLGVYELGLANPRGASDYFKEALSLDPRSAQALVGLADAMEQLGQTRRAAELRRLAAS